MDAATVLTNSYRKGMDAFIESEHPRGQPQNAGEFVKKSDKELKKETRTAKSETPNNGQKGGESGKQAASLERAAGVLAGRRGSNKNYNGSPQNAASGGNRASESGGRSVVFQKATPDEFHSAIEAATKEHFAGAAVHVYSPEEYKDDQLYLTDKNKAGFALKGNDIISVFKSPDSNVKHFANAALSEAVKLGGRRLDCFDTVLPDVYSRNHFKAVARLKWNDEYAPEGWDYEKMRPFNNGRPDVVFMVYDPKSSGKYQPGEGKYVSDYDEGTALQQQALGIGGADAFIESEHPRGQPENAGEFVEKGKGVKNSKKPKTPEEKEKSRTESELAKYFRGVPHEERLNRLGEYQRHRMEEIHRHHERQIDLEKAFKGSKYKRKLIIREAEKYSYKTFHEHLIPGSFKMMREFTQEDYEVLHHHFYEEGSKVRKELAAQLKHHAMLLPKILKSHALEEVNEYKDAAIAIKDLFEFKRPDRKKLSALREVATTAVLVSAMLGAAGELSVESLASFEIVTVFGREFVKHTILEHLIKFAGGLARFLFKVGGLIKGDAKAAAEKVANITSSEIEALQQFFSHLADVVQNLRITTNQFIKAVYNLRKRPAEDAKLATDPPVSEAQRRAMFAAASGHSTIGIPKSVGKEFSEADPGGKLPEKKSEDAMATAPNAGIPAAGVMLMTPHYRILFGKRRGADHAGDWAFPAGRVEEDESPEEAAKREAKEEVNFEDFDDKLPLIDHRKVGDVDFSTYLQEVPEEFDPEPNEEFSEFRWAYPDEAPEPLHPGVKETLSKYLDDDDEDDDDMRKARDEENPHGKLSKETREEVDSTKHREDMPEDAFLGPHRTYPVKEKRNGKWEYTKDLLEAAERRAVSQNRRDIAGRAHAILERQFGLKSEKKNNDESFTKLEHSLAHKKGVTNPKALAAWIGRKNGKIPGHDSDDVLCRAAKCLLRNHH